MRAEFSSVPCSVAVPRQPSEFSLSSWERCRPALTSPEVVPYTAAAVIFRAANDSTVFTITEKAHTRAFSWLKAPTSAFTFKTLLRHYAKRALTPR